MKRYTSIKFILLTMIIISGSFMLKASSGIGINASKILNIEGEMRTLTVEASDPIPEPYDNLQELLDDNPDIEITTSSGNMNNITLSHDRDEYYEKDDEYWKYKRYYILEDDSNIEYELIQIINKRLSSAIINVGTGSASMEIYHPDANLASYSGGSLYNPSTISAYINTYFPQINGILANYCINNVVISNYSDATISSNDCQTVIRRTHSVDANCGTIYRYTAIVDIIVYHANQSITVSGSMQTINIKEEESFPTPATSVVELMAANPISVQATSLDKIEVSSHDEFVAQVKEGKKEYRRTYVLRDKCNSSVSATIVQTIYVNATIIIGDEFAQLELYHPNADLHTYNDGYYYLDNVLLEQVNAYFYVGIMMLADKCPDSPQTGKMYEEITYGGDPENFCNTLLERTFILDRENDGVVYRYIGVLEFNLKHYNEKFNVIGLLGDLTISDEESIPSPYSSIEEMLEDNPGFTFECQNLDNVVITNFDDDPVEVAEGTKKITRNYYITDECDESLKTHLVQIIYQIEYIVVDRILEVVSLYHPDDDLKDYMDGALYDKDKIGEYLLDIFPDYDVALDEHCDDNSAGQTIEWTEELLNGEIPLEERCYSEFARWHDIKRVCTDEDGKKIAYIYKANLVVEILHFNDDDLFEVTGVMDTIRDTALDNLDELPKYTTVEELTDANKEIQISAMYKDKLSVEFVKDENVSSVDCEEIYHRYYKIKDKCSFEDANESNNIEVELVQVIVINSGLKIEGEMKTRVYYDIKNVPYDVDINLDHLLESGLTINGFSKSNVIHNLEAFFSLEAKLTIEYEDFEDEKLPYVFEREFTIRNVECGAESEGVKVRQRYEPDVVNSAEVPEISVWYGCDTDCSVIPPANNTNAILEYLKTLELPVSLDELTFNAEPFDGSGSLMVYYKDQNTTSDKLCVNKITRVYHFTYEYYGFVYEIILKEKIEVHTYDSEETEVTTIEKVLSNDTIRGCIGEDCLPPPLSTIDDFKKVGVNIPQGCGLDKNIDVKMEEVVDYDNGCEVKYDRFYSVYSKCTDALFAEVKHSIIMYLYLDVYGYLPTIYYEEDIPDAYTNLEDMISNGLKFDYNGDHSSLVSYNKDFEMENIPNRIERRYYISTSCTDVIDSISQYLVKISPKSSAFEVIEVNDLSFSGSDDGSIVLRIPQNDQLEEGQTVYDAYDITLKDENGTNYNFSPGEENTLVKKYLGVGVYYIDVYPKNFNPKSPLYSFIAKISEKKMHILAMPYMALLSVGWGNCYVETLGYHYYETGKFDLDAGGEIYTYIQNDNATDWRYTMSIDEGKFIDNVLDNNNDETFTYIPQIQMNYEVNSQYFKPRETIALTLNAKKITFTAHHRTLDPITHKVVTDRTMSDSKSIYWKNLCLSNDPNEIFGPVGYGEDKMIAATDRIDYKIMFENDPNFATAAAARVKITCLLHPHANPTTINLGQYGFGDYIFEVPPMSTYYSKRHDLADSLGVWLDVTAGIDVENNEMYWIFQSIDPETGIAPIDAIGFLPVNDTLTGSGEGFVTFSVMSIDDMKTGDTISEQANIIFDENENMLTNTYTNMFDAVAPTSTTVCDSSGVLLDYNLIFKSVAADDENGSGVRQVDLYANVDKTQYVLVGTVYPDSLNPADTMLFQYRLGEGSLYQFKFQAIDNVGNKEPFPDKPQITYINNNPPIDILLSNRYFYEDDEIGTVIGEFTTLDDQSSDAFTYSLVDEEGYDNDFFLIDGKKLKLNKDLRCFGRYMYTILVKTTDVSGDCFNKAFILFAEQTMTPPTTLVDHYLCKDDYIEIAGNIITEDGYYYDTIPTPYGCDSIVKHIVRHRPDPVVSVFDEDICMYEDYDNYGMNITWDSIQEHLVGWDQLNETTLVFKRDTINAYGCHDEIQVNLTIRPASRKVHDIMVCANDMPYIYGDSVFIKSGTKDVYFTSKLTGCDSIVTVNLEVAPSYYDVPVFATICDNEYYMLFDDTIREAGTYYKMGESSHHCDSSVYLTLEVLPTSSGFGTLNICASELPYTYGDYTFDATTVSGTYDVVFPAANGCDSIVALELTVRQTGNQENNFSGSWDWYSTFLDDEQLDVLAELKEDLSSYGKVIKSNTEFINYAGGVWSGNLTRIDNEQMYMVQTNMPQPTLITACVANPEEHPITIKKDWNYIGYISQYAADVNEALAGLSVNPKDGDIIKSYRDGFAVYFESIGMWFGDLMMMQPGQGYQYMSKNNDDIVLTYPQLTQSRAKERAKAELNWMPSYKYPDNMTFVADIVVDDWVCDSDTLEVGAFCNGEKRGNARAIYIKELGAYRVFLTTYGNNGDELYFMLYDHESQEIAAQVSNQRVVFEVNATFGSLLQPYSFEFNTSYNTLIEESICFGGSYNENGFETSTEGSYFKTLKDENGNDSIVKLRLEVNPTYRIAEDILVDQFPYEYDGVVIEKPSVHAYSYTSVHGCDSIMVRTFMYELEDLMLVPNPANKEDRVLVLSNLTEEDKAGLVVEVYNAIGLKIQAFEPRRFPIELREIDTSGSYMIRVMTGTGKILTTKLIIM